MSKIIGNKIPRKLRVVVAAFVCALIVAALLIIAGITNVLVIYPVFVVAMGSAIGVFSVLIPDKTNN